MLIFELFRPQTEGMGFLGEKDVEEAANAARQAAIAIAMKKAHKKPRTEAAGTRNKTVPVVSSR